MTKTDNEDKENKDDINDDEKLLILPLNDKSSKKISQVISNDTAREILGALTDEPQSTTDVAEKLGIPLTTAQYNIEKLVDAGLVKVERTKWSEKFREVKIYAPQKKLVVILPEKTSREDVVSALRKYLPILSFAAVLSGFIELVSSGFSPLRNMFWGNDRMYEVEQTSIPTPTDAIEAATEIYEPTIATTPTPTIKSEFEEMVGSVVYENLSSIESVSQSFDSTTPITAINMTNITPPAPTAPEATDMVSEAPRILSEVANTTPTPMEIAGGALESGMGAGGQMDLFSHIGFWFFLGAVSIVSIMFLIDWYRGRKGQNGHKRR